MNIDDENLLLGFFVESKRRLDGSYYAGIGIPDLYSTESFRLACNSVFTHVTTNVPADDKWTYFFSVIYSVVKSIEEFNPEIILGMKPFLCGQ